MSLDLLEASAEDAALIVGARLYKYDTKGKLRTWWMEQQGNKHHTVAGLDDGVKTVSEWTVCVGKQKRTDIEQAAFEIASGYTYQLAREYFETPEEAEGGARFFKPMLAEKWKDIGWEGALKLLAKSKFVPEGDETGIYAEPKLDGFCCIAQASGLTAREGPAIISVPHVNEALKAFFDANPEAVLHGELYNHEMKEDFEGLVSILKKQKNITPEQLELSRKMAQLHLYDYPAPGIRDLRFSKRKEALIRDLTPYVEASDGILHIVETTPIVSEKHLEEHRVTQVDDGYEGQMPKLDIGPYEQKRSKQVRKNKVFDDAEFELVDIVEGKGNYTGYAKRATFVMDDGRTFGAGIKGGQSVFNAELLKDWSGQKIATVRYFGLTKYGLPRMGVVVKWHGLKRTL